MIFFLFAERSEMCTVYRLSDRLCNIFRLAQADEASAGFRPTILKSGGLAVLGFSWKGGAPLARNGIGSGRAAA